MEGKPVQISLEQMGASKGKHVIFLGKDNAKKLMKSYLKGKGLRMSLTPLELQQSIREGAGLLLPSPSKGVASHKQPIVEFLGGSIDKLKSAPKSKMPRFAKGSPEAKAWGAKMMAAKAAKKGKGVGADLGKSIGKVLGAAGGASLGVATANPLVGAVGSAGGATLGSRLGEQAGNKIEKLVKGRGAKMSEPYKQALKMNFDGLELPVQVAKTKAKGSVDKRVKASSDEMTLSPYQKTSSPAMNPFVPMTYAQEGGTSSGYGQVGSGLIGAGMMPKRRRRRMGAGLM